MNLIVSFRATSSESLARSSLSGEELVIANFSTFTELLQSKNTSLQQILTQNVNRLSKNGFISILKGSDGSINIGQDLADHVVGFSTTPQVQIGLSYLSMEISSLFKRNIFSNQIQVVGIDLDNLRSFNAKSVG
jgi:hypothetical protein